MNHSFRTRQSNWMAIFGLAAIASLGVCLPSQGQSLGQEEDIVMIGETPEEWAIHSEYWQRLLNLSAPPQLDQPNAQEQPSGTQQSSGAEIDVELEKQKLIKRLKVSHLEFKPMVLRGSSSQVLGTLQNNNDVPVSVASVNFEIVDEDGDLVRTGAVTPQPSIILPGKSVTFNADYLGFPRKASHDIRLSETPFFIDGSAVSQD